MSSQQEHSTEKKSIQLTFGIKEIKVFNFSINSSPEFEALPPSHEYTFEINATSMVEAPAKIIGIDLAVYVYTTKEKKEKVCELTLRVQFNIINFDEIVTIQENQLSIADNIIEHLIAISISSARGILYEKVRGSFLSSIILPIINLKSFHRKHFDQPIVKQ